MVGAAGGGVLARRSNLLHRAAASRASPAGGAAPQQRLSARRVRAKVFTTAPANPSSGIAQLSTRYAFHWIGRLWWFIAPRARLASTCAARARDLRRRGRDWRTGQRVVSASTRPSDGMGTCLVTLCGIVLQAQLARAASALSNMDAARPAATEARRRQAVRPRVPMFLREKSSLRVCLRKDAECDEAKVRRGRASTLKVRSPRVERPLPHARPDLQVPRSAVIAMLVQCVRSRVYLPAETVIEEGERRVRSTSSGGRGRVSVKLLNVLGEFDFFGEQSFLMRTAGATVRAGSTPRRCFSTLTSLRSSAAGVP